MSAITEKPELIHDETFMMDIFKVYRDELPPFKEYWDEMFTKKQMPVVARKSGSKVVQLAKGTIQAYKADRQASSNAYVRACSYCYWCRGQGD